MMLYIEIFSKYNAYKYKEYVDMNFRKKNKFIQPFDCRSVFFLTSASITFVSEKMRRRVLVNEKTGFIR